MLTSAVSFVCRRGELLRLNERKRLWVVEDMSRLNDPMRALRILEKSYGGDLPAVATCLEFITLSENQQIAGSRWP